jgi:hypothetical protein
MTSIPINLQQFVHAAVDEAVNAAMVRQRSQHPRFVPGTIQGVSGPIAKVIPDDALVESEDPEQFVEAVRLDWAQGVQGGVVGDRNRTILMTLPGGGVYCLGAIPSPGETADITTDPESFISRTASDSARTPGNITDMFIRMDLTEGYLYGVHLHSQITWSAGGSNFIELNQDLVDIGRFWLQPSTTTTGFVSSTVVFEAQEDIDSSSFIVTNGGTSVGNLTLAASSETPRTLTGFCIGPTRRAVPDS